MENHIKQTIERLVKLRDLYTYDSNEFRKMNSAILILIEKFAPWCEIEKFKNQFYKTY